MRGIADRLARAALWLAPWLVAGPASAAPPPDPSAPTLAPRPQAIVGGEPAQTCAWPQVGALTLGGTCTATLVHPRVIVYAAHCGTLHSRLVLGESTTSPQREVELLRCERASDVFGVSSMDFAYCELAEPLDAVPSVPLLFGCDESLIEVGTPVTIVGFGRDDEGTLGTKRVATTSIVNVLTLIGIGGMGVGADSGDSGGPALVELPDGSHRVLGIVSGGGGGGAVVQYVPAPVTVAWLEDRSGIDLTPCHASDGSWAPTPACGGFYVASEADATWAASCPSVVSGLSDRCGPAFSSTPPDRTAPTLALVAPSEGEHFDEPASLDVAVEAADLGWGVREVRLELDGQPWLDARQRQASDEVPPYLFEGLELAGAGEHAIVAIARDWAGNETRTPARLVHVEGESDTSGSGSESESDTSEADTSETSEPDTSESSDANDDAAACRCSTRRDASPLASLVALALLAGLRRPRPSLT